MLHISLESRLANYVVSARVIRFCIDILIFFSSLVLPWYFLGKINFFPVFVVLGFQMSLFKILDLDDIIWRYIGFTDLKKFFYFSIVSTAMLVVFSWVLPSSLGYYRIPIYVSLTNGFLVFMALISVRVLRRAVYEYSIESQKMIEPSHVRTLLVGAGMVGITAAAAFRKSRQKKLNIIGFIDDDPRKRGSYIQQIPVLGTVEELPELVKKNRINLVVITIAKISGKEIRCIVDICKKIPVEVRVVPGYGDIFQGNFTVNQLREIKIEDLLKRDPVELDLKLIGLFLENKRVLISGAGGSIGSELCRQVIRFKPKRLILLDISEAALFEIEQELLQICDIQLISCVGNCTQSSKIEFIFKKYQPEIVLHAAAYKHVSLMEQNPFEAMNCNVFGTQVMAKAAGCYGVETFVLVSTDKAVRPTSVMGASKRLAELVVSECNQKFGTAYMTVRFGNVLGSSGSVVPIFKKQIAQGGPVTVTDPNMIRYFMTIPEACQLILQAACTGKGGELFVLDMGEPVKILDLAKDMIRLSGLVPEEDIPIVFSGAKRGEKLAEQLYTADEIADKTEHSRIFLGHMTSPSKSASQLLLELSEICRETQESSLRNFLNQNI